jgi:AcrR family transcriptional regulator
MNERKKHVIKMAHQLFIDKGFQATSIQDILEYSNISKGTFYNYFSSKNELLIALLKEIYSAMENERNQLLIGKDPSDIDIFKDQIELQMNTNQKNKLMALFEEVLISNDEDLKQFIKKGQLRMIQWTYKRFIQLFGEDKKPYLLDCAIMFQGILHQNTKYFSMANQLSIDVQKVVQFSVNRMIGIVHELAKTGEQLHAPELLKNWLPNDGSPAESLLDRISDKISELKKELSKNIDHIKYIELLDFIQEELSYSIKPRKLLLESSLLSLKQALPSSKQILVKEFEDLIKSYFKEV